MPGRISGGRAAGNPSRQGDAGRAVAELIIGGLRYEQGMCIFGTGYEEIEALTVVDILRRQKIDTQMVSVTGEKTVTGSHQISVQMDCLIGDVDFGAVDVIVLPGGMPGTKNLEACDMLMEQVDAFAAVGKTVCAICAAPSILGHRGLLKGKKGDCLSGL